jgi:hypothetical protein
VLASPRLTVNTAVDGGGGAVTNTLLAFVQVDNQLLDNADPAAGRVNTNDFIGEEYLISFRGLPGLSDVVFPANFTVRAESSSTPVVPIIPPSTMVQIAAAIPDPPAGAPATPRLVIAEVKIRGHLLDGSTIETGAMEFAVDVFDEAFTPAGCPTVGDVRFYCPNAGQTASTACEAP